MISHPRQIAAASAIAFTLFTVACAHGGSTVNPGMRGAAAVERQVEGSARAPRLDHLIPARDSQGSLPKRFEWTPVPGAESYSIGIWNEVDTLIWRHNDIRTNSFEPTDLTLEPGTYFWSISALQGGEEITTSGLSAFVVRPSNP